MPTDYLLGRSTDILKLRAGVGIGLSQIGDVLVVSTGAGATPYSAIDGVPTATVLGRTTAGTGAAEALGTLPSAVQANITATGALNSGSITSGFGAIDVGADAISGGAITGTTGVFSTSVSTPSLITAAGALTVTPAAGSNLNVVLSTTGDFAVNTNQLYVDTSSGNVGIGTTSSGARLHTFGASAGSEVVRFESADTATSAKLASFVRLGGLVGADISYDTANSPLTIDFGTNTNHPLTFKTNNAEKVRIDAVGNVGIGTTNPLSRLQVQPIFDGNFYVTSRGISPEIGAINNTNDTYKALYLNASALYINPQSGGNVGIGTTGPSALLSIAEKLLIDSNGLVTKYNNIPTAGWGVPAIVASNRATGQTAANTSVATYTVGASDGSFEVGGDIYITTDGSYDFYIEVAYTDETNASQVLVLPLMSGNGSSIKASNTYGLGPAPFVASTITIRAKASTAITIKTAGAGGSNFTSVTYTVEGFIKQIA